MSVSSRTLRALGATHLANSPDILETEGYGIFQPTATTAALLQVTLPMINQQTKMLDLGCGWGIIGLEAKLSFPQKIDLYMSDSSESAVKAAVHNSQGLGLDADIRVGSIFEPWGDANFDLIVSDVSGVSSKIPFVDKWFNGIPCESGEDGLDLVTEVISLGSRYLSNLESKIIMPVISLSNVEKAEEIMHQYYQGVNKIVRRDWFLEITEEHIQEQMEDLKSRNCVDFMKNSSKYTFYTDIYQLTIPRI